MLTRHTVAENLLKSRGSRRTLCACELAAKIEKGLKELERASEEYESFLELERLHEHLTLYIYSTKLQIYVKLLDT